MRCVDAKSFVLIFDTGARRALFSTRVIAVCWLSTYDLC